MKPLYQHKPWTPTWAERHRWLLTSGSWMSRCLVPIGHVHQSTSWATPRFSLPAAPNWPRTTDSFTQLSPAWTDAQIISPTIQAHPSLDGRSDNLTNNTSCLHQEIFKLRPCLHRLMEQLPFLPQQCTRPSQHYLTVVKIHVCCKLLKSVAHSQICNMNQLALQL